MTDPKPRVSEEQLNMLQNVIINDFAAVCDDLRDCRAALAAAFNERDAALRERDEAEAAAEEAIRNASALTLYGRGDKVETKWSATPVFDKLRAIVERARGRRVTQRERA